LILCNNTIGESEEKIKADFKEDEWENGDNHEERSLRFLHSRGRDFLCNVSRPLRKYAFEEFLQPGLIRKRMMLVVKVEEDEDKSSKFTKHYVATCLAIHRYFQQNGARGFAENMLDVLQSSAPHLP